MERAEGTPELHFEPANTDDAEAVARLWCDAFPGDRTVAQRVRTLETGGRYGGIETVCTARDGRGELAGACKAYRMVEYIAGAPMPMMGLAAVAVAPSFRRRGVGARLCSEVIRASADRGDAVSVLYPFRPAYYERLGWGLVGSLHEHLFRTAELGPFDAGEGDPVRAASAEIDGPAIADCYQRVTRVANGPIRRDRAVWRHRLLGEQLGVRPPGEDSLGGKAGDPGLSAVVYDDGGVTGYALVRYAKASAPERSTLQVRELLAENEVAYRGLLAHLASQRDQWPHALHHARPGERFGDRLRDPRPPGYRPARSLYFPTARVVRGPMLRVLDVASALRLRPLGGGPARYRIEVRDPQRRENEGPWSVEVGSDGGVEVAPGRAGRADATVETDASTFARIFVGELGAVEAARMGRARVDGDPHRVDRAFATEPFWLLDEF